MNETDIRFLCRICLSNSSLCSNIYLGHSSDEIPIYEVINYVYDLEIIVDDGLPEHVCLDCLGIIREFESYKTNAHRAKRKLMSLGEEERVLIKVEKEDYLDITDAQVTADSEVHQQQDLQKRKIEPCEDAGGVQTSYWLKDTNCGSISHTEFHHGENMCSEEMKKQEEKSWPEEEASGDSSEQRISKEEGTTAGERVNGLCVRASESKVVSWGGKRTERVDGLHSTTFGGGPRERDKSEKKKHKCTFCDKVFDKRYCMTKHLMTHTGEKPYQCDTCKYRSSRRSDLRTHMYIHTGERPFKCNICDYRTVTRSSLRRHINTHSAWKPFQCKQCDYKSSDVSNFRRHMYTHADKGM